LAVSRMITRTDIRNILFALVVGVLPCLGCKSTGPRTQCPFDLQQVLSDCGLRQAQPVQPVAWRRMADKRPLTVESVVLVAIDAKQYVLLDAYRHPGEGDATWSISATSTLFLDGRESWMVGKREFAGFPTEQQLAEFLHDIDWERDLRGFVVEFQGTQRLNRPTSGLSQ